MLADKRYFFWHMSSSKHIRCLSTVLVPLVSKSHKSWRVRTGILVEAGAKNHNGLLVVVFFGHMEQRINRFFFRNKPEDGIFDIWWKEASKTSLLYFKGRIDRNHIHECFARLRTRKKYKDTLQHVPHAYPSIFR
jgi:hypothetical protein